MKVSSWFHAGSLAISGYMNRRFFISSGSAFFHAHLSNLKMELGLTIPLQRHLKIRSIPYGEESDRNFCWDLHVITLNGRASLLAVHCSSRYAFILFDLNWSEWNSLGDVFLDGLHSTFQSIGISEEVAAKYLRQADGLRLTKTHGRREVAYLNRVWEDVLAFDYTLDHSTREQPLLDHAVNTRRCRCAGFSGEDTSKNRLLKFLQGVGCVFPEDAI